MIRRRPNGKTSSENLHSLSDTSMNNGKNKNKKVINLLGLCTMLSIGLLGVFEFCLNSSDNVSTIQDMKEHSFRRDNQSNVSSESIMDILNKSGSSNHDRYMHVVFSTDCGDFQHWQSYLLFYSAYKVRQHELGTIIRIASGCSDNEKISMQSWHDDHIRSVFGDRYLVHFTPKFSSVKDENGNVKGDYKFFNKPLGVRHWLDSNLDLPDNDVIALIDPDMLLLRRLSWDFSNSRDVIFAKRLRNNPKYQVEIGQPFGQTYGLGAQWRTFNLDNIAGSDSPAKLPSHEDAFRDYPVGPPYIATVTDFRKIVMKWCEFVPKVHAEYPYLLAEMYAYCIAAAHLRLPHMRVDHLMVSNVGAGGEGWPFVDQIAEDKSIKMCNFASVPISDAYFPIPSVIHYCQRYFVDKFIFYKRNFKTTFYDCNSQPLEPYPSDLAEEHMKNILGEEKYEEDKRKIKRNSFMLCAVNSMLNDSLEFYKNHHCQS